VSYGDADLIDGFELYRPVSIDRPCSGRGGAESTVTTSSPEEEASAAAARPGTNCVARSASW
jgi:hypothetical protein